MTQPQPDYIRSPLDLVLPPAPSDMRRIAKGELHAELGDLVVPPPNRPKDVADLIRKELYTINRRPTLLKWRGDLWEFSDSHGWQVVSVESILGTLYEVLNVAVYPVVKKEEETLLPWNPGKQKVHNVLHPMECDCAKYIEDTEDAPKWIGRHGTHPAQEYLPVANGLLHLPTRTLEPHTPGLFTTYRLPYGYDPGATAPRWESFLKDVFEHDPKGIRLLQEYFGYVLSGRKDMQKALLLVGPSRSGKGVISKTLKSLVGETNTRSVTFESIASQFGLQTLIGKPLAIFEDIRGDARGNSGAVQLLLTLIGEDGHTVRRKFQADWAGDLPTRFMLVSNEVPRMLDASGAVVGRFMVLTTEKSYRGKEDLHLAKALRKERPGILNWALEGLNRLEQQGRFTEPEAMADIVQQMGDAASPLKVFLEDTYEITGQPEHMIPRQEVFEAYKWWCHEQGYKPTSQAEMANRLQAVGLPSVRASQPWRNGTRTRVITGIKPRQGHNSTNF